MLRKLDNKNMGRSDLGWLKSIFHFSFSSYYNKDNMNFGVLRVLNDDLVKTNTGFEMHPHKDMEIVSYVVDGELTHGDSIGNKNTITRGHVQYMSAGTGIYHSEHNLGENTSRFLQIWIIPNEKGLTPNYGDYRFQWEDRRNKWLQIVSSTEGNAPIKIYQDANIHVLELEKNKEIDFKVREGRQAYLVQIEGISEINGIELKDRDALEVVEEDILIKARETSNVLVIEMKKGN
ncbi:pirin family protein [Tissierella carlieri]|jgi:redox-sensitive bicupin YhaK (pirin superfamily)|uniref:pirin family protein n=1 Tax=Tissierella carlieri TaxID=689904 RepID=UPI001C11AE77|nr:pirin family protein [Tissierella carlieri]MBU5312791.1 pirin family protein [Tissierella carlieri]